MSSCLMYMYEGNQTHQQEKLNLLNKIRKASLKVVSSPKIKKLLVFSPIVLGFFLILGTNGQAIAVEVVEEVVGNGKDNLSGFQKAKVSVMAITSLKDILDPTCPMPKRIVSKAKFTCCTSAIVSFAIAEAAGMGKIPMSIRAKATMCCE